MRKNFLTDVAYCNEGTINGHNYGAGPLVIPVQTCNKKTQTNTSFDNTKAYAPKIDYNNLEMAYSRHHPTLLKDSSFKFKYFDHPVYSQNDGNQLCFDQLRWRDEPLARGPQRKLCPTKAFTGALRITNETAFEQFIQQFATLDPETKSVTIDWPDLKQRGVTALLLTEQQFAERLLLAPEGKHPKNPEYPETLVLLDPSCYELLSEDDPRDHPWNQIKDADPAMQLPQYYWLRSIRPDNVDDEAFRLLTTELVKRKCYQDGILSKAEVYDRIKEAVRPQSAYLHIPEPKYLMSCCHSMYVPYLLVIKPMHLPIHYFEISPNGHSLTGTACRPFAKILSQPRITEKYALAQVVKKFHDPDLYSRIHPLNFDDPDLEVGSEPTTEALITYSKEDIIGIAVIPPHKAYMDCNDELRSIFRKKRVTSRDLWKGATNLAERLKLHKYQLFEVRDGKLTDWSKPISKPSVTAHNTRRLQAPKAKNNGGGSKQPQFRPPSPK